LDPDKPWNQVEFERQLETKRREWSRLVNSPTAKGLQAKKNISTIPELKRMATDEGERKKQAEACKLERSKEQSGKLKELEENIRILAARGFILQAEYDQLVKQFSSIITQAEIKKRIKVPIQKGGNETQVRKQSLDPLIAKRIETHLKSLGMNTLYEFLGLDERTESKLLVDRANRLYADITAKGVKSNEDTVKQQLVGDCLTIFKNPEVRQKYNESLRLASFAVVTQKMDLAAQVSNRVEATQVSHILREARQLGLDPDETMRIMIDHAGQKRYAIFQPTGEVEAVQNLQFCGYCKNLNEAGNRHCSVCGRLLAEPCPRCGQSVKSSEMACGKCGFPSGNWGFVEMFLSDAADASKARDYAEAVNFLEQANQAWPGNGKDGNSKAILEGLQQAKLDLTTQHELHSQVENAISERKYYLARSLLVSLLDKLPQNSSIGTEYKRKIELKIRDAEDGVKKARELHKTDPESAIQLLQSLLASCSDCKEARDLLSKTPPSPPAELRITLNGKVARLSWKASISKGVKYAVVRGEKVRPSSASDGHRLGIVSSTIFDDEKLESGVPYFYAVYANREESYSTTAAWADKPVFLTLDVDGLSCDVGDQHVYLRWAKNNHVEKVTVVRSLERFPRSISDGTQIQVLGNNEAIDSQLVNGKKYYYSVFCHYKDIEGNIVTSHGVQSQAIPQPPPPVIEKLRISASSSEGSRHLTIEFDRPEKEDVIILRTNSSTGMQPGIVINNKELGGLGHILKTNLGKAFDEIKQAGLYYYTPVILFNEKAYMGFEHRYASIEDVDNLNTQNMGHALRLTWKWPMNCDEVVIVYSNQNWPKPDDLSATSIHLTRAQYEINSYFDIMNPAIQDYYILVLATIGNNSNKITATGDRLGARKLVRLKNRTIIEYKIKKRMLSGNYAIELDVQGDGEPPSLVLIRKQNTLPLSKKDGELIMQFKKEEIRKGKKDYDLREGAYMRQGYAKLFLEDESQYDTYLIRHPAKDALRLF